MTRRYKRWHELARQAPRRQHGDTIEELELDVASYNILRKAGIDRVSVVRALREEHGSLRPILAGFGPARDDEVKAALDLYDDTSLDINDPDLRAAAHWLAITEAAWRLLAAAELADDDDRAQRLRRCVTDELARSRPYEEDDERTVHEATDVLNQTLKEVLKNGEGS